MNESWDKTYKNMWDERYSDQEYAYGKGPNIFFKEWLKKFGPWSIFDAREIINRGGLKCNSH